MSASCTLDLCSHAASHSHRSFQLYNSSLKSSRLEGYHMTFYLRTIYYLPQPAKRYIGLAHLQIWSLTGMPLKSKPSAPIKPFQSGTLLCWRPAERITGMWGPQRTLRGARVCLWASSPDSQPSVNRTASVCRAKIIWNEGEWRKGIFVWLNRIAGKHTQICCNAWRDILLGW